MVGVILMGLKHHQHERGENYKQKDSKFQGCSRNLWERHMEEKEKLKEKQ